MLKLVGSLTGFSLYSVTYTPSSCFKTAGFDKVAPSGTILVPEALPLSLNIMSEGTVCLHVLTPVFHVVEFTRQELQGRDAIVAFCVHGGAVLGTSHIKIEQGALDAVTAGTSLIKTSGIMPWPDLDGRAGIFPWPGVDGRTASPGVL